MAERRYSDREIAAIFRAATESPETSPREVAADEGMTLAELQAIGKEVGISSDAVAQAAQALEIRGSEPRTFLGLPIGVRRTVNLNRRLSDEEWERLVVQLREVFNARGITRSEGSLRQWSNGNLQVLLEPTESGHRLRFGTLHGAAAASIRAGIAVLFGAGAISLLSALQGSAPWSAVVLMGIAGLAMIANGALRLPRWARVRARQMDALAAKVAGSEPPSR